MWQKILMLIFSIMTSTAVLVSIIMHTWIETSGAPQKRYGLLRVEIIGCGKASQGTGAISEAIAGGAGAVVAALESFTHLGCSLLTTDTMEGELTYQEYTVGTCKESTSAQCVLAQSSTIFDPTNWCETLKTRCTSFQTLWKLNQGLWYFLVIAVCGNLLGAMLAFRYNPKSCSVAGSVTTILALVTVIVIFIVFQEQYAEPPPISENSVTGFGPAFFVGCTGCVLSLLQIIVAYCIYQDKEKEEAKREKDREKERLHKKDKRKGSKGQDSSHIRNYSAMDNDGSAIADNIFGIVLEAIRQRGYSDVAQAFHAFDVNGNGYISADEFDYVSKQLGLALAPEQVQWLLNQFDQSSDGNLDYNEFSEQVRRYAERLGQV